MITYEYEGERLADTSACAGVRADLKMCLLESSCCKIVGNSCICLSTGLYQNLIN